MANRKAAGLTLLELLATLAVLAVMMAVAVPSFQSISARNRLAVTVNQLVGGMLTARTLAISRNVPVTFCAGNADEGCHGDWTRTEWIVFTDRNRDGRLGAGDDLHVENSQAPAKDLVVEANGPFNHAVVFGSSGAASWPSGAFAAGRLRVCVTAQISPNATELVLIGSGRTVSQSCELDGLCPALSDQSGRCK